jgi:hypothetical protein
MAAKGCNLGKGRLATRVGLAAVSLLTVIRVIEAAWGNGMAIGDGVRLLSVTLIKTR